MKTLLSGISILLVICGNSFAADDCPRGPNPLVRESGQNGPSELRFSYESRVERQGQSKLYSWCIESDKNNRNVAEFRWGDERNNSRYLGGLIEPGRGLPSLKTDGSKSMSVARKIKFTRKNRDDWQTIDTATVTSKTIGLNASPVFIIPVQLSNPSEAVSRPNLDRFKDEDGTIQIDRLSADRDAFVSFVTAQKQVSAGASMVVTIPVREQIAELLQKNAYEKYNPDDFVRAKAALYSHVGFSQGKLTLWYSVGLVPEGRRSESTLGRLLSDRLVSFRVIASEPLKAAIRDGLSENEIALAKFGSVSFREIALGDRSVFFAPAILQVSFGKGPPIGSFEAPLFAPK